MFDGSILIGGKACQAEPRFGTYSGGSFSEAGAAHVEEAAALAAAAAPSFAATSPEERARFLELIADALITIGDTLITTAMGETGLPRARLEGERGRTAGQLRLFAAEIRRGVWLDATIDRALPERAPPRPDLRRAHQAIGPVAVFGASNFPLAFSVAGGDTASALAAGCPVIVKGHPAHPATGELAARAIQSAAAAASLHEGVFSYLPGTSQALGGALVADPRVKAVGFTGSRAGGLALARIAAARPEPIPVYAEMSAINPVLLLPAALDTRAEAIAAGFVGSLTLGAGQFCTNPGLLIAIGGRGLDRFQMAAIKALREVAPQEMLTAEICASYQRAASRLEKHAAVTHVASGKPASEPRHAAAALFETDADSFLADPALSEEVFGASALIVRCRDEAQVVQVVKKLEGQLTASLHAEAGDHALAARLLPLLAAKAGRVLVNGWPTGVEVCHAMVHGGPFPATSDSRTTSVGTLAMARFLRPVCWQDIPDTLLPPALQEANPWRVPRTVDGQQETPA